MRTDVVEIAVQCNGFVRGKLERCKQWNALTTTNLRNASTKCKLCGKTLSPRGVNGYNLKYEYPKTNETLSELVMRLNNGSS